MHLRCLAWCAPCVLLVGCVSGPNATEKSVPVGYHYYDAVHPGGVAQTSPQALYNASHGTWLWPPVSTDFP
jgi:hypothetical protein